NAANAYASPHGFTPQIRSTGRTLLGESDRARSRRPKAGADARNVALAIVRSENTRIVKALAREPPGAAGLRLLQQCNVAAARGCFSGKGAVRESSPRSATA
ncbi:MAG TPA: hypothetical protein VII01_11950, partial [Solirubrobacteraceae bacterium]